MNIVLETEELLIDIRTKSHEECANTITEVEARYRTEAGNHKNEEIYRCLLESASALSRILARFLHSDNTWEADDTANITDGFQYDFDVSERRMDGKSQALADAMHSYIVHDTLRRFYGTVSAADLATKHTALAQEAEAAIKEMMYSKKPPII